MICREDPVSHFRRNLRRHVSFGSFLRESVGTRGDDKPIGHGKSSPDQPAEIHGLAARDPEKHALDIDIVTRELRKAKELIQNVMEALRAERGGPDLPLQ